MGQLVLTGNGRVISGGQDGVVQLLTLDGSAEPEQLGQHGGEVAHLVLTADGRVISGGWDGVVQLLTLDGSAEPRQLGQHNGGVAQLVLTGDGRVISGGGDGCIYVWNTSNGQRVARWTGDYAITRQPHVPEDNLIVAGDAAGNIHVLEFRP